MFRMPLSTVSNMTVAEFQLWIAWSKLHGETDSTI
jgi:hypothetical protein